MLDMKNPPLDCMTMMKPPTSGFPVESKAKPLMRAVRAGISARFTSFSVWPTPYGSELSRRAIWLPAWVHAPE